MLAVCDKHHDERYAWLRDCFDKQYLEMKDILTYRDAYLARSESLLELNDQLSKDLTDAYEVADVAEQRYDALRELHSGQTRVVTWTMDPIRLTAQLRAIEPSLRVERDGDKMSVYANVQLSEAQINAVNAVLLAAPNRT